MTPQQQLIAWLSLILVVIVVWTLYRPYLSTLLFKAPSGTTSITSQIQGGVGGDLLNALNPVTFVEKGY